MAKCEELVVGVEIKRCSECENKKQSNNVRENDHYWTSVLLASCRTGDREFNHVKADNILTTLLLELGYVELTQAFEELPKWYA